MLGQTYTGHILTVLNPYEKLPLYSTETINSYKGKSLGVYIHRIDKICQDDQQGYLCSKAIHMCVDVCIDICIDICIDMYIVL